MRKLILTIIVLMILPSAGHTADWKYFGTNNDDSVYSFDAQGLTRGKDTVKVWSRVVLGEKGKAKIVRTNPEVSGIENVSYAFTLWEIDCSKKMSRTVAIRYYTSKGDALWSDDFPDTDFEQIPPDTIISSLLEAICEKGEKPTQEK